jgi:hypothetical protein
MKTTQLTAIHSTRRRLQIVHRGLQRGLQRRVVAAARARGGRRAVYLSYASSKHATV